MNAIDYLGIAIAKTLKESAASYDDVCIAVGMTEPANVREFNRAVLDLRELIHQYRIATQAKSIHLGMPPILAGTFWLRPEDCEVPKLKELIISLRTYLAYLVDNTPSV